MSVKNIAKWEALRSATAGAIGASYTAIGSALSNRAVIIAFKNNTDGDVVVSYDGSNDHMYFPSNSFTLWDVRTNAPNNSDLTLGRFQFYVKDGDTASSTGSFYIEVMHVEDTQ